MPAALPQDLPPARQHLPRAEGRGTRLHPAQDEEEPEPRTDPAALPALSPGAHPRADWAEFKELLDEAGISDRRQHDGSRHTAGTILNELGIDMPTIMEILRHTQISQTRRYVKGRSELSREAMRRMGEAFMPGPNPVYETRTETESTRTARARRRRKIR